MEQQPELRKRDVRWFYSSNVAKITAIVLAAQLPYSLIRGALLHCSVGVLDVLIGAIAAYFAGQKIATIVEPQYPYLLTKQKGEGQQGIVQRNAWKIQIIAFLGTAVPAFLISALKSFLKLHMPWFGGAPGDSFSYTAFAVAIDVLGVVWLLRYACWYDRLPE